MENTKYMSKEYTACLRGIFALCVVAHHLYQHSGLFRGSYIGAILQLLGYVSVAVFFFFSGYGLMFSSQKENYLKGFLRKRFIPLYCFYVFLIVLYSIWTFIIKKSVLPKNIVQSFFFGGTIVTNGWYFQATFVMYLLFFLTFTIFKNKNTQLLFFSIGILFYCVACNLLNFSLTWYQTIPCAILGMLFCCKKPFIDELFKKYVWLIFIVSGVLFAGCYLLSSNTNIKIIFNVLYSLFFVCTTVSFAYILSNTWLVKNKITAFCGKYSLEIYATHGLFLPLFKLGYIKNVYVYILVVILGTLIASLLIKKVYLLITSLFKTA